ncbi:bifunctional tRNA (5-methylaminomethyl-2-thiouridine)(34)-methyltransferase MnmD/FAD-dependent 5-carboxymethylaminomethyl-2-thiouridine(34) oxidoreductase MnmC [Agitococcus lubricus]|uniref:tRNA 5-methylaminomethyl-2-thiouridine biosynthesis bifunctional protein MnmC n=1 Tax=Agitococcus lubricus TaxID=1077255 RepID=A0A2T5IZR4_9GAMM|nr:bifunctional tRNA (5-methylaminomethyl-2-thiouridine)(34)-methyltransferase MnmD/FAD-dependent 5-carboxymethylaminomethyl-2-thiouridine(34) oxidoreductase MnmC [Agitococcus lubricus]PTQ89571.1 tRNA 5-methylaminomethyl-2-thiouridine biosynthesis bifunctional protein [Agitococcus lubricus]
MVIEPADICWRNGLPFSQRFNDIYFSLDNGLAETEYVFLEGNQLAERFASLSAGDNFTIAETGFGTGLNILAAWRLWEKTAPKTAWLHIISVEKHPLTHEDLSRALALWPELAAYAQTLLAQYPPLTAGWHRLVFDEARISLTLILGDANELLPEAEAQVDAWFLDGFAPDRNPELWQLSLLTHVARLSKAQATLATFSAAGAVRRHLEALGFAVYKQKGFGRKREMIRACYVSPSQPAQDSWQSLPSIPHQHRKHVAIIGAGIAGVSCAYALAIRGWQVTIIDQAAGAHTAASGNPAAIIYPKLAPPALSTWHFQQQAYLWLLNRLQQTPHLATDAWQQTGLLWLLAGNQQREGEKLKQHPWPASLVQAVNAQQASHIAGLDMDTDCLYFPQAGYLNPHALSQAWLNHPNIRTIWHCKVTELKREGEDWQIYDEQAHCRATSPVVIVANALAAEQLSVCSGLTLTPVRGQIATFSPTTPALSALKTVLCYGGYLTPAVKQQHCIGASFWPNNANTEVTQDDHQHNYALLAKVLPKTAHALPPMTIWQGRAALRAQTNDYLPLVGALADYDDFMHRFAGLKDGKKILQAPKYHTGLYVSLGHGSKGFCYAPLAAEIIAAQLNNEPLPVARRVLQALFAHRFWVKHIKRQRHHDQKIARVD